MKRALGNYKVSHFAFAYIVKVCYVCTVFVYNGNNRRVFYASHVGNGLIKLRLDRFTRHKRAFAYFVYVIGKFISVVFVYGVGYVYDKLLRRYRNVGVGGVYFIRIGNILTRGVQYLHRSGIGFYTRICENLAFVNEVFANNAVALAELRSGNGLFAVDHRAPLYGHIYSLREYPQNVYIFISIAENPLGYNAHVVFARQARRFLRPSFCALRAILEVRLAEKSRRLVCRCASVFQVVREAYVRHGPLCQSKSHKRGKQNYQHGRHDGNKPQGLPQRRRTL